jgi:gas vesicle protein
MKEMIFFLMGVVVGAALALLFAPASGDELRTQIQTKAGENRDRLRSEWESGKQRTGEQLDKLQSEMKKALHQEQAEPEEVV